jgi:hypothetical protein
MYIELLDAKKYLGIEATNEKDDVLLEKAIEQSKAWIDGFCLRTFEASVATTRYLNAVENVLGRQLLLDRDLCTISSIVNGNAVTVNSSQYTTLPINETPYWGIVLKASAGINWTYSLDPEGAIVIVGKWAYSLIAPDAVKAASLRLTAFLYRVKDAPVFAVTAISEVGAMNIAKRMPIDVQEMLLPYRRAYISA